MRGASKVFGAAIATGFALAAGLSAPAAAQQSTTTTAAAAPASSLDELLDHVAAASEAERRLFESRVAEFNAASEDEQQAMLEEAETQRDEVAAASMMLSDQFSANELRITDLNSQLNAKSRELGLAELFGLARQVAEETAGVLEQSLITTQFPAPEGQQGRAEFLRSFSNSRLMPKPEQLERLWYEIHREMTAQGEVARYTTTVVQPSGEPVEAEVVRIGPFTAMSDGRFLSYLPELETLSVLPRQLPNEFMEAAADFLGTMEGYAPAVVDYTRGVLLGLYVDRPTLIERIELGEAVGYVIIAVGIAGALAFLFQLFHLISVRIKVASQLKNLDDPRQNNPLGRVLLAFKGDPSRIEEDADVAELRISEAVLREVPKLERFQAFLRLAVAAGPLLGLIGTVWGMIITFQSITEAGTSDPKLMATGIGQAMIATVLGLGVAIPLLFANALLNSLSRTVVQILDEQSAGMLAESIERRRANA
ncbi:MAG TPA: MotA/TolQ/ExbB proton channel family protein [Gammaproteobacteria bacterium]